MTDAPPTLTRYRATVSYDGTAYNGFQKQAGDTPTIQGALENAVQSITGQAATVTGAGRTDTGVHATGQVIAFDVDWRHSDEDLLRALNTALPEDIALQDIMQHPGFHPRYQAASRIYKYHIVQAPHRQPLLRDRAWLLWSDLNMDAMASASMLILGEHDFAAFGRPTTGDSTIRLVMESHWTRRRAPYGWDWTYTIEANAFLQHMVRRLVGVLVEVGRGRLTLTDFEAQFRSAVLIGAITLAPPQGLVLDSVKYEP
jgi:tRNA pseudouridine38-40 synthase